MPLKLQLQNLPIKQSLQAGAVFVYRGAKNRFRVTDTSKIEATGEYRYAEAECPSEAARLVRRLTSASSV